MSKLARVLEPEWMDTAEEATGYDAMDHAAVNAAFAEAVREVAPRGGRTLDLGCGTALIPLELWRRHPGFEVVAVDAARHMLRLARAHVARAGAPVALLCADCKRLPLRAASFDVVMSNSIVHHLPDPAALFAEIARVARPAAAILVRDLVRPHDRAALDALVARYAAGEPPLARQLFADSLHAALTLEEVEAAARVGGLSGFELALSSDRHWTLRMRAGGA